MKLNSLLVGLYCLLLVACGSHGIAIMKPEVDVVIVNRSARLLENAEARFGEYACGWGLVVPGATKGFGFYPHPITAETELHWYVGGIHRVEKIKLSKIFPKGKSGRLTFAVYDDRVEVSFRDKS